MVTGPRRILSGHSDRHLLSCFVGFPARSLLPLPPPSPLGAELRFSHFSDLYFYPFRLLLSPFPPVRITSFYRSLFSPSLSVTLLAIPSHRSLHLPSQTFFTLRLCGDFLVLPFVPRRPPTTFLQENYLSAYVSLGSSRRFFPSEVYFLFPGAPAVHLNFVPSLSFSLQNAVFSLFTGLPPFQLAPRS